MVYNYASGVSEANKKHVVFSKFGRVYGNYGDRPGVISYGDPMELFWVNSRGSFKFWDYRTIKEEAQ